MNKREDIKNQRKVPLVFLLGFLGSGKTTFLNNLLATRPANTRVGMLINEWGYVNVDGKLVQSGKKDEVIELSGGQVFCSCISGSFMDSSVRLLDVDPDILLVEASGLARPSAMRDIMDGIIKLSDGRIVRGPVFCVVDTVRFPKLLKTVAATKEQVLVADVVVCAKTDLASSEEKRRTFGFLGEMVPDLPLLDSRSKKDLKKCWSRFFKEWKPGHDKLRFRKTGWGVKGRPVTVALHQNGDVDEESLRDFLKRIQPLVLRAKGILAVRSAGVKAQKMLVEIAGNEVHFKQTDVERTPFVIIGYEGDGLSRIVRATWKNTLTR